MMGNLPICLIAWPNINEQIAAMQEVAAMRVPRLPCWKDWLFFANLELTIPFM
eukprot:CAMPEP_0175244460 /NCGR_PEP_ID=MMETSP0093-20121207/32097_1 /TAXON_ID=311494 /ORGANISM="Alexandrium monilatum, Strain CCMP3105" /LENGTH=52 /DNA_ID=CAMNT_0016538571 /DNA_START=411 /DNA_END=569 /DNA_ORIENTATION=+